MSSAIVGRQDMARVAAMTRLDVICAQFTSSYEQDHLGAWGNVSQAPPDPVLGLNEAFAKDDRSFKVNVGVGAYRTEEGKPLVLRVVREAEKRLLADDSRNKEYLPITGSPGFCRLARELAFSPASPAVREGRVATAQALSGTGALRVGAEFISQHYPGPRTVLLPDPTWPNHKAIFARAGLRVKTYRYWAPAQRGLDFQGLLEDLEGAEDGSVLLLHACAHNPTGVDPTSDQWQSILGLVRRKHLLPFFDSAYQGFASGDLDADATALRLFAAVRGLDLLLAQSFAKNMGLYGERVGALSVVCRSAEQAKRVESQLKMVIRPMYSNPPAHGAAIASLVLADAELFAHWKSELAGMASRIQEMRVLLRQELERRGARGSWEHITSQIGMFSYTGLNAEQCKAMNAKHAVYLTLDGRISMAGVRRGNVAHLAAAITDVFNT